MVTEYGNNGNRSTDLAIGGHGLESEDRAKQGEVIFGNKY